jgi:hypothetical protein
MNESAIHWLLDSDPSIRWQGMRDLTHWPADEVAAFWYYLYDINLTKYLSGYILRL